MHLCIPVLADLGLQSPVSPHFGSTPLFMIVDTNDASCRALPNGNLHHAPGQCSPLASLQGEHLDGVVVTGIGGGALEKLKAAGIPVYATRAATVAEVVRECAANALGPVTSTVACVDHAHGGHAQGTGS